MKKSKQIRKKRKKSDMWFFLFVMLISFIASTSISYFYFTGKFALESSFITDIESRHIKAGTKRQIGSEVRLYESDWNTPSVRDGKVSRKDTLLVIAEDVIRKYMEEYGVRLLDLYMDKAGIIYIDLSGELKKNFKGDAFEELNIIGGLYKKINSAIPGFTALKILIEGRETESFGGHLDISKPIGEKIAESI